MKVTATYLENKVNSINQWLSNNPEYHPNRKYQKQKRSYYVGKLCEMDQCKLEHIEI